MEGRYPLYNYKTQDILEPKIKDNKIFHADKITRNDVLDATTYSIQREWALKVAEAYDEKLFSEIIKLAREAGITDVTILDKEFIITAIKNEMERRNK